MCREFCFCVYSARYRSNNHGRAVSVARIIGNDKYESCAALIACDGLDTVRTVTGREYHYSLCGSWRTAAHAYAHHNHKEEVFGE